MQRAAKVIGIGIRISDVMRIGDKDSALRLDFMFPINAAFGRMKDDNCILQAEHEVIFAQLGMINQQQVLVGNEEMLGRLLSA